jgi:hypothetical protein
LKNKLKASTDLEFKPQYCQKKKKKKVKERKRRKEGRKKLS